MPPTGTASPYQSSNFNFYVGLGFDPDVRSATEGLVRAIDDLGRTVDRDGVAVGIAFVSLDREHGFVFTGLSVALDDMLVHMNAFNHKICQLSIGPWSRDRW